jgi:calcium-dependent protein kinase
LKKQF